MMGLITLQEKTTESLVSLSLSLHVRIQREGSHKKSEREFSPETDLAGTLMLDF